MSSRRSTENIYDVMMATQVVLAAILNDLEESFCFQTIKQGIIKV